jgi:hypothetical protein
MTDTTIVAGIEIPSTSPIFLTIVGLHVLIGSVSVVSGVVAMLSPKRAGRHPTFGSIYFWSLSLVFLSATILSAMRWRENYHLFMLGTLAFAAAICAREAVRRRGRHWATVHITGMGSSYTLLLTAFMWTTARACPCGKNFHPSLIGSCRPRSGYHSLCARCCAILWQGTRRNQAGSPKPLLLLGASDRAGINTLITIARKPGSRQSA